MYFAALDSRANKKVVSSVINYLIFHVQLEVLPFQLSCLFLLKFELVRTFCNFKNYSVNRLLKVFVKK